jgi:two-component system cell cycle response regulator DivK
MVKVLVIEDNPVNMKLAVLLLGKAGHSVRCASDAETGLALVRTDHPDLILMDLQLPGMDGLTATALLKRDPATAAIPVIALTAMVEVGVAGQMGACDACIAKPLRYQELYAAIDTVLGGGKPPQMTPGDRRQEAEAPPIDHVDAVDVKVLKRLIGDDPVVVLEFQDAFRRSAAKIAEELRAACVAGHSTLAATQAHKLRSAANMVGALALGRLCAELEIAGKADKVEALMQLWPAFAQELAAVNAFLDGMPGDRAEGS